MSNKAIFVPGVGQHENIGDIILRRPLINWLRDAGQLHIYVGSSSPGYDKGLGLQADDVVYYSFVKWYLSLLWFAIRAKAHYAFKPGEIQLTLVGLKEHIVMLPLLLLLRISGGKVIRIGSGARNFKTLPMLLMKPSMWLANILLWRDPKTTSFMGSGATMPDLAFAEGTEPSLHSPIDTRKILVLSMRGDRGEISLEWLEAVKQYAANHGLEIHVVTQVLRDSTLSKNLARQLQCQLLDWDGHNHDQQEQLLRQLYANTHTVVSDRLHVLITAYTQGALPIGMLDYNSDKIDRHFAAIGLKDLSIFSRDLSYSEVLAKMEVIYTNRSGILAVLQVAREKLVSIRQQVVHLLVKN